MTNPLLYDAIIVVVLVWCALRGAHRGFILTVSGLVVLLCAIWGANMVSTTCAPMVSQWVAPKLEAVIETQMAEQEDTEVSIQALLEGTQLEGLLPYVDSDILEQVGDNAQDLATEVVTTVAQSLANGAARIVLWLLTFVALMIVLTLLVHGLDLVAKLPLLSTLNSLGGLVAGLVKGAIMLYIALLVCGWLGYLPTADVASQTHLYSRLLGYNPVAIAIL